MSTRNSQAPRAVLMVRPASFGFNLQTAASNAFQIQDDLSSHSMQQKALAEFDQAVAEFSRKNIACLVVEDTAHPEKPDAIFPNNWFSTHENGTIVLYPMLAGNRRLERRDDIIELLRQKFVVNRVLDWSREENQGRFLEGTGSIIFDHVNRVAYACRSPRTHESLLVEICGQLEYRPVLFDAVDEQGTAVYHSNVMMWVGEKVACICLDSIPSDADQEKVLSSFEMTGHQVVAISYDQMKAFAGNMLQLEGKSGSRYFAMSRTALQSLLPGQLNALEKYGEPLPVSISSIEKYGGGGIRCMLAGIHLLFK